MEGREERQFWRKALILARLAELAHTHNHGKFLTREEPPFEIWKNV
jgi:hypothetical protein